MAFEPLLGEERATHTGETESHSPGGTDKCRQRHKVHIHASLLNNKVKVQAQSRCYDTAFPVYNLQNRHLGTCLNNLLGVSVKVEISREDCQMFFILKG